MFELLSLLLYFLREVILQNKAELKFTNYRFSIIVWLKHIGIILLIMFSVFLIHRCFILANVIDDYKHKCTERIIKSNTMQKLNAVFILLGIKFLHVSYIIER
jgi:hypothetical protein